MVTNKAINVKSSRIKTLQKPLTKTGSISVAALEVILVVSSMTFIKLKALKKREVVN